MQADAIDPQLDFGAPAAALAPPAVAAESVSTSNVATAHGDNSGVAGDNGTSTAGPAALERGGDSAATASRPELAVGLPAASWPSSSSSSSSSAAAAASSTAAGASSQNAVGQVHPLLMNGALSSSMQQIAATSISAGE